MILASGLAKKKLTGKKTLSTCSVPPPLLPPPPPPPPPPGLLGGLTTMLFTFIITSSVDDELLLSVTVSLNVRLVSASTSGAEKIKEAADGLVSETAGPDS